MINRRNVKFREAPNSPIMGQLNAPGIYIYIYIRALSRQLISAIRTQELLHIVSTLGIVPLLLLYTVLSLSILYIFAISSGALTRSGNIVCAPPPPRHYQNNNNCVYFACVAGVKSIVYRERESQISLFHRGSIMREDKIKIIFFFISEYFTLTFKMSIHRNYRRANDRVKFPQVMCVLPRREGRNLPQTPLHVCPSKIYYMYSHCQRSIIIFSLQLPCQKVF